MFLMDELVAFSLTTNVGQAEYAFSLTSQYTVFVKTNTKVTLAFLVSNVPLLHLCVLCIRKVFLRLCFLILIFPP